MSKMDDLPRLKTKRLTEKLTVTVDPDMKATVLSWKQKGLDHQEIIRRAIAFADQEIRRKLA